MKSMSPSMERKGRKRKRSVNYDEVRQHVQVEVEEESLVNISNVSDLSEELALDDCISAATFTEQISTQGTFSHVRFVDTDSDVEPSPEKNLSSFACFFKQPKQLCLMHLFGSVSQSNKKMFLLRC